MLHPDYKVYQKTLASLHDFMNDIVEKRKQMNNENGPLGNHNNNTKDELTGTKNRLALLDLLIQMSDGGNALSDEDIREEVMKLLGLGDDPSRAKRPHC